MNNDLFEKLKKRLSKQIKPLFWCLCLLVFVPFQGQSNMLFKNFSISEGLAQSQVFSIIQDHQGYIWMSSNGGGVSRFNGLKFTNFSTDQGLADNSVNVIREDSRNNIWFGTEIGLTLYKDGKFRIFTEKDGLPNNAIWSIFEDQDHRLWFGTTEGLCYYANNQFHKVKLPRINGVTPNVNTIESGKTGQLWLGTNLGLFSYQNGVFKHYTIKDGLTDNHITCLKTTPNGNLFIGTHLGITLYNYKKFAENPLEIPNLVQTKINHLIFDNNSNLWIGSDRGAVRYKMNGEYMNFTKEHGMSSEKIMCIYQDRDQKIWLGTDGGGVDFYSGNLFSGFSEENGLHSNTVWSFNEDKNGHLWIGHDDGISIYNGEKFTHLVNSVTTPNYNPSLFPVTSLSKEKHIGKTVFSLYRDKNDQMWIGTESGASCFDGKKFRHFTVKNGLPANQVYSIIQTKNGDIWFGTRGGVAICRKNKIIKVLGKKDGLPNDRINSLAEDRLGNIWIGTSKGLAVYNGVKVNYFNVSSGLNHDHVFGIQIDKNDNVWIGTYGGGVTLFKKAVVEGLKKKNIVTFTKKDGLTDNEILFIILDGKGNLFAGANKGLNKIETAAFFSSGQKKIKNFGITEGFYGLECDMGAVFKDQLGTLWFGTIGGAIALHSEYDLPNTIDPKININAIRIDYKDTMLSKNAVLGYKNKITFSFIGISTSNPEKVRYKFILEGYDDEWSPATTETSTTYANLPAGNYIFNVISCNNEGVWNKTPASYAFSITPPFWKTTWFYILVVLLLISSIFAYTKWRIRSFKQAKHLLEMKILERTAELHFKNLELEKLSIVASETHNSVMICKKNGHIEWSNSGFSKLFGFSLQEYKQMKGETIFDASTNPHISTIFEQSVKEKKPVVFESIKETKDGKELQIQSTLTPILDKHNEVSKLVIIDADITELKNAKAEIEAKSKDILDSIHYAERIQKAMLPPIKSITECNEDLFILYKPKDIVSGDFYWFHRLYPDNPENHSYFIAAIDCTGHGVPGAYMSMIGNYLLNQILAKNKHITPDVLLTKLNTIIRKALHHEDVKEHYVTDGMDVAICLVQPEEKKIIYSGANRPLIRVRQRKNITKELTLSENCLIENNYILEEFKGDRKTIGGFTEKNYRFSKQSFDLEEGDVFYLFTDGYADQFGGEKGKKYLISRLLKYLISIQDQPINTQDRLLNENILHWQGNLTQLDDILVIGLRT